jgi:hypothetical protein
MTDDKVRADKHRFWFFFWLFQFTWLTQLLFAFILDASFVAILPLFLAVNFFAFQASRYWAKVYFGSGW